MKLPVKRSLGSLLMLWIGGLGLTVMMLWWMVLITILFFPDPGGHDTLYINSGLTLITISLLLTVFFLVILRSGLRGPADPLAPENNPNPLEIPRYLDDGTPTPHARGRKSHLRVVRPSL